MKWRILNIKRAQIYQNLHEDWSLWTKTILLDSRKVYGAKQTAGWIVFLCSKESYVAENETLGDNWS